jgi:hypothetical protein
MCLSQSKEPTFRFFQPTAAFSPSTIFQQAAATDYIVLLTVVTTNKYFCDRFIVPCHGLFLAARRFSSWPFVQFSFDSFLSELLAGVR